MLRPIFKRGGTAAEAVAQARSRGSVAQARSRGCAAALTDFPGSLVVGIAYDPDSKSDVCKAHKCVIER